MLDVFLFFRFLCDLIFKGFVFDSVTEALIVLSPRKYTVDLENYKVGPVNIHHDIDRHSNVELSNQHQVGNMQQATTTLDEECQIEER